MGRVARGARRERVARARGLKRGVLPLDAAASGVAVVQIAPQIPRHRQRAPREDREEKPRDHAPEAVPESARPLVQQQHPPLPHGRVRAPHPSVQRRILREQRGARLLLPLASPTLLVQPRLFVKCVRQ